MILLDYLPSIFLTVVLGAFFAFFLKMLFTLKHFRFSLLFTFSSFVSFLLPFTMHRAMKKRRTELLREVNKNKTLSKDQKKAMKRIISSNFKLFYLILKFTISNYREIMDSFIEISREEMKREDPEEVLVAKEVKEVLVMEAKASLFKDLTKPLGSYLSKSVI